MAETTPNPVPTDTPPPRLRDLWHVPAVVAGIVVLGGAIVTAVMTAPKPDLTDDLKVAHSQVEAGKYAEALTTLNTTVLPHIAQGHLSREQLAEFHLLRARGLYLGQREAGLDRTANHENIKKEYASAEKLGAKIEPDDLYFLAQTALSLGEVDEAMRLVESFPEGDRARRLELLKAMTDRSLAATPPEHARALDLIALVTADPALDQDDRVWALTRQAELLMSSGYPQDAVTKIVRAMPRLEGARRDLLGDLLIILGRAYVAEAAHTQSPDEATDALHEAQKQLGRAASIVGADHPKRWLIALLLAEIEHHHGALGNAREGYRLVLDTYGFSEGRPAALLGLAEVEAQRSNEEGDGPPEESLRLYDELVTVLLTQDGPGPGAHAPSHPAEAPPHADLATGEIEPQRAAESLLSRFKEQYEKGRYPMALQFAALAEKLLGEDASPAELMLGLAEVHKRLAEEVLSAAGRGGLLSLAEADAATQREAREHLLQAGEYYKRHSNKVVITDAAEFAHSLWDSADAFDRAGDLESSVIAFQQFVTDFPSDTRHAEAIFRLAQASQAAGDMERSARLYQELIDSRGSLDGAGPFADASYVPLARALFLDADATNDARGEDLLTQVVSGEVSGPTTLPFREGLRELADQYHRTGRYPLAIERYEQYLSLQGPQGGEAPVDYRLAESCRKLATEIERALRSGMPEGTKRELEQQREAHLVRAGTLYAGVRGKLEAKKPRTALEGVYLRNAYFYEADCAFDLGDYADAVRRYDAARERYAKEPAALMAMTQIVSALLAQGETSKAQIAHQRAKRFYESMPESVWDDPTLPMNREGWQRWLDAQAALTQVDGGGSN